jgi:hypothetical protein
MTSFEVPIDSSVIKSFKKDPFALAFFKHAEGLSGRDGTTTVDQTMSHLRERGTVFSRLDVVELFKRFHGKGLGEFIVGRRGRLSRFKWTFPIDQVSNAVLDDSSLARAPLLTAQKNISSNNSSSSNETKNEGGLVHTYNLRPNLAVSIYLPRDLSEQEAKRLADFICTLPFDKSD